MMNYRTRQLTAERSANLFARKLRSDYLNYLKENRISRYYREMHTPPLSDDLQKKFDELFGTLNSTVDDHDDDDDDDNLDDFLFDNDDDDLFDDDDIDDDDDLFDDDDIDDDDDLFDDDDTDDAFNTGIPGAGLVNAGIDLLPGTAELFRDLIQFNHDPPPDAGFFLS